MFKKGNRLEKKTLKHFYGARVDFGMWLFLFLIWKQREGGTGLIGGKPLETKGASGCKLGAGLANENGMPGHFVRSHLVRKEHSSDCSSNKQLAMAG